MIFNYVTLFFDQLYYNSHFDQLKRSIQKFCTLLTSSIEIYQDINMKIIINIVIIMICSFEFYLTNIYFLRFLNQFWENTNIFN